MTKAVFSAALASLLIGALALTFGVYSAGAGGTIRIKADGKVEGTTSIFTVGSFTYVFEADINGSIVVERDNIIVDGNGRALRGAGVGRGLDLSQRKNVTVKNTQIEDFSCGIWLGYSSHNVLSGNDVKKNNYGVVLDSSSNNNMVGNDISDNSYGIWLYASSDYNGIAENNVANNNCGVILESSSKNSIGGNNIANNGFGVEISSSSDNNSVSGNNIANNVYGILLSSFSDYNSLLENEVVNNSYGIWLHNIYLGNMIFHNRFIDNNQQVHSYNATNSWDDGYPSGGNYWSDFSIKYPSANDTKKGPYQNITGNDGIWDSPYAIDPNNTDNYPLVPEFQSMPAILFFTAALPFTIIICHKKHRLSTTPA